MGDRHPVPIDLHGPSLTNYPGNSAWSADYLSTALAEVWGYQYLAGVIGQVFGIVTIPQAIGATPNPVVRLEVLAPATVGLARLKVSYQVQDPALSSDRAYTAITEQDLDMASVAWRPRNIEFAVTHADLVGHNGRLMRVIVTRLGHADTLATRLILAGAHLVLDQT